MTIVRIVGEPHSGSTTTALLAVAGLIARDRRAGRTPNVLLTSRTAHWAEVHRRTLETSCMEMGFISCVEGNGGDYHITSGVADTLLTRGTSEVFDYAIIDGLDELNALLLLANAKAISRQLNRIFLVVTKELALKPIKESDYVDVPPLF